MTTQQDQVGVKRAQRVLADPGLDARTRIQAMIERLPDSDAVTVPKDVLRAAFALPVPQTRYAIVSDDDGHHYVIEAGRRDEFYELEDDEINNGRPWMWIVGGAPNQVTFTDPEIFGEPLS